MTPSPQHCAHECVCPDYHASHSEDDYDNPEPCTIPCMQRMEAAAIAEREGKQPIKGCHWWKEELGCTKEGWLDEWEKRGGPKQIALDQSSIQKTSELPRIIPPLPEGDTKDLKIWKKYWTEHDARVLKEERERIAEWLHSKIVMVKGGTTIRVRYTYTEIHGWIESLRRGDHQ